MIHQLLDNGNGVCRSGRSPAASCLGIALAELAERPGVLSHLWPGHEERLAAHERRVWAEYPAHLAGEERSIWQRTHRLVHGYMVAFACRGGGWGWKVDWHQQHYLGRHATLEAAVHAATEQLREGEA